MIQIRTWRGTRCSWRPWAVAAGTCLLAGVVTCDAWVAAFESSWRSPLPLAVLLPIAAGYLMWVRRARIWVFHHHCWLPGLLVVAAGGMLYIEGLRRNWPLYVQLGAAVVLVGSALAVLGLELLRRFLPPVALIFASLIWPAIAPSTYLHDNTPAHLAQILPAGRESPWESIFQGPSLLLALAVGGFTVACSRPMSWQSRLAMLTGSLLIAAVGWLTVALSGPGELSLPTARIPAATSLLASMLALAGVLIAARWMERRRRLTAGSTVLAA